MPKTPLKTVPAVSSSPQEIMDFRLRRQHLRDAVAADPVTLCRDVCGVQAQVMSAAYLQLLARNPGIRRAEIDGALWQSRALVKTSLMRQTLHLIPSDEFSTYIAAVRTSRLAGALRVMARFGVTREEADALTVAILDTLSRGPLGRAAIRAAVRPRASRRVRAWMEKVWSILRLPVAEGLVCYGPGEGNEVNFIRVDQWLPDPEPISELEAQCRLLRNYLRAYGPATVNDFSHWAGIPVRDAHPIFDHLKHELVRVGDAGGWILARDRQALNTSSKSQGAVKLLPSFDPFLLAHSRKGHLVEERHYKRVYRNQGWISPVILLDGKVVGTWSHSFRGSKLVVELDAFGKLSRAMRAGVESEAASLARFFNQEVEIHWPASRPT
jgi:Winged helix DNA-binding domain